MIDEVSISPTEDAVLLTSMQILEAFHHPYFNTGRSRIQEEMFEEMKRWISSMEQEESERIIESLTKVPTSVRLRAATAADLVGLIGKRSRGQEQASGF